MNNATRKERLLHHVTITVFSKPHDDDRKVRAGLDALSPVPVDTLLSLEKEHDPERPRTIHYRMKDIVLTTQTAEIDDGKMVIYTLFFKKMHDCNAFCKKLLLAMTPMERMAYRDDPSGLLDDEGHISVRFDKTLLMEGRLVLTEDGNCYQVKASVAAYPRTEEGLLTAMERLFKE